MDGSPSSNNPSEGRRHRPAKRQSNNNNILLERSGSDDSSSDSSSGVANSSGSRGRPIPNPAYSGPPSLFSSVRNSISPARTPSAHQQPIASTAARLVDLTNSSPQDMPSQLRKRPLSDSSPDPSRPSKRARQETTGPVVSSAASSSYRYAKHEPKTKSTTPAIQKIEEVDLLDVDDDSGLSGLLRKQQEEQVQAQRRAGEEAPKMSSLQCIICLDTPTDLTVTWCGHFFCHKCLMDAIAVGEVRNKPRCPVCRKAVHRKRSQGRTYLDYQVLELKLSVRKRKGKEPAVD
ncbi:MAG: hypothetical protein M1825_003451 [Sarcosagium campestre]|nr:MAG: hypothetical protein M1825_003451 [Sarcosagium campestre]